MLCRWCGYNPGVMSSVSYWVHQQSKYYYFSLNEASERCQWWKWDHSHLIHDWGAQVNFALQGWEIGLGNVQSGLCVMQSALTLTDQHCLTSYTAAVWAAAVWSKLWCLDVWTAKTDDFFLFLSALCWRWLKWKKEATLKQLMYMNTKRTAFKLV